MPSIKKSVAAVQLAATDKELLNIRPDAPWYRWQATGYGSDPYLLPMYRCADTTDWFRSVGRNHSDIALFENEPTNDRNNIAVARAIGHFSLICAEYSKTQWVVCNDRGRELYENDGEWTLKFLLGTKNYWDRIHAIGFHWYVREESVSWAVAKMVQVTKASGYYDYLEKAKRPLKLWLTEFAHDDPDIAEQWMLQAEDATEIEHWLYWTTRSLPSNPTSSPLLEGKGARTKMTVFGEKFAAI